MSRYIFQKNKLEMRIYIYIYIYLTITDSFTAYLFTVNKLEDGSSTIQNDHVVMQ